MSEFKGEGWHTFETSNGLSKQERTLLDDEEKREAQKSVAQKVEILREKEGPKILSLKYAEELGELLDQHGDAHNITLQQILESTKKNKLRAFEPVVVLAALLEVEERRNSTIH